MHSYGTMDDMQSQISFGIYQGEARNVEQNVRLGDLKIPVPAKPKGEVGIDVRFTYNSNGLLEVDVHVPLTDFRKNLVIVDEDDRRSAKDIEESRKALEKLKVHPRDEAENAALMARAQRAYEGFTGMTRSWIGEWITDFEGALESQDRRTISEARERLTMMLDKVEADPPL